MSTAKVGQISVTLGEPPANTAQVACGQISFTVGAAAGKRFFDELAKIREALVAAHAVLTERGGGETTPAEMHLGNLLVDLEMAP